MLKHSIKRSSLRNGNCLGLFGDRLLGECKNPLRSRTQREAKSRQCCVMNGLHKDCNLHPRGKKSTFSTLVHRHFSLQTTKQGRDSSRSFCRNRNFTLCPFPYLMWKPPLKSENYAQDQGSPTRVLANIFPRPCKVFFF